MGGRSMEKGTCTCYDNIMMSACFTFHKHMLPTIVAFLGKS